MEPLGIDEAQMGKHLDELFTRHIDLPEGGHADATGEPEEDACDYDVNPGDVAESFDETKIHRDHGKFAHTDGANGEPYQPDVKATVSVQHGKTFADAKSVQLSELMPAKNSPDSSYKSRSETNEAGYDSGVKDDAGPDKTESKTEGKEVEAKTRTIKTSSGTVVNLTIDKEGARFTVQLPDKLAHGKITGWAERNGRKVATTDVWYRGLKSKEPQAVSLSITKAEYDEAMADVKSAKDEEVRDIKTGKTPISVRFQDGEYLSGHAVYGPAAEMLVDLGVAKEINGWGTSVDEDMVKSLGKEFTYPQAAEYARPRLEAEKKRVDEKAAAVKAKFDEARTTGKPVLLHSGTEHVSEREERETENSLNVVNVYAMPDGTTKTTRHGTY